MTNYARLATDTVEVRLVCKSCGKITRFIRKISELFDDDSDAAIFCSYCGTEDKSHVEKLRQGRKRGPNVDSKNKIPKLPKPEKPEKPDKPPKPPKKETPG